MIRMSEAPPLNLYWSWLDNKKNMDYFTTHFANKTLQCVCFPSVASVKSLWWCNVLQILQLHFLSMLFQSSRCCLLDSEAPVTHWKNPDKLSRFDFRINYLSTVFTDFSPNLEQLANSPKIQFVCQWKIQKSIFITFFLIHKDLLFLDN